MGEWGGIVIYEVAYTYIDEMWFELNLSRIGGEKRSNCFLVDLIYQNLILPHQGQIWIYLFPVDIKFSYCFLVDLIYQNFISTA